LWVQINGESREVGAGTTLDDLVGELSLAPTRIAVELNQRVVRRDKWAETILADGDRIEIVHFVGGGDAESSRQEAGGGFKAVEQFLVSL
jgi:thiamine biosynthesis protein ThiS